MIFIGMNHPKHFWMFKKIIENLNNERKPYKIFVSEKDVLHELLHNSNIPYVKLGENKKGLDKKIFQFIGYFLKMLFYSTKYKPKVFLGKALPHFAFASFFIPTSKFYILEDTEHVSMLHKLTVPFCKKIFTPQTFPNKFGKKQTYIPSFYEFLYLHPNNFIPKFQVLNDLGYDKNEKFTIIRLVSWNAHHDNDETGVDTKFLKEIIHILVKNNIKILISSEQELPDDLQKYSINISASSIHSLLHFAYLYIGEGATMAAEAALLGTPAIYINSLNVSYCEELSNKYDLIYNFRNSNGVLDLIDNLLKNNQLKNNHMQKLKKVYDDKIDPVPYFMNIIST